MKPTKSPAIVWPRDIQERYAISAPTRWRWERTGRLPARDFYLSGRPVGWHLATIEVAERGPQQAA